MVSDAPFANRQLHFVGIGGCGMSGLALVARSLGARVSGSDQKESIYTGSLRRHGITDIALGHRREQVPPAPAEVVYPGATAATVEVEAAHERGQAAMHRSELLAELTAAHRTIAVGGAHGKSSTAALLAHVLTACGKDPSYVVGALLRPPGEHAAAGTGGSLVIEADESDASLLRYQVDTAVVTNVDLDHVGEAGGYREVGDVANVLGQFAAAARCSIASAQAAEHLAGLVPGLFVVDPELIQHQPTRFRLDGQSYEVNQPGAHQLRNAALVVYVAIEEGCAPDAIRAALLSFPGLARRFELRGKTVQGARVIDDYAHHPVEVAAALATARASTDGRVLAVFQPHLYTRTEQFLPEFLDALAAADWAWVEPVYPARQNPADYQHVAERLERETAAYGDPLALSPGRGELAAHLASIARPDDVVILIGAGDVTLLADLLVA